LQGKEQQSVQATGGSLSEGIPSEGRRAIEDLRQHRGVVEELGVHRRLLYKWRDQFAPFDESAEPATGSSPQATLRRKMHQLKRVLVDKTLEVDFFKGALQKVEARRQQSGLSGGKASTTKSKT
jgi:transposase-like protein